MKTVTKKLPTKRGKNLASQELTLIENREKYINTSSLEGAAQIAEDKPLTERQTQFVKHWAAGESINTAMIKAGFDENSITYGWRLVRQPNVLALYNAEKRKYEESVGMTRKKVMEGFLEAAEMAKLMADPTAMVSAWREVGRMCGYYEPVKKKIDINVTGNILHRRLESLSDAELLKLIMETPDVAEAITSDDDDDGGGS